MGIRVVDILATMLRPKQAGLGLALTLLYCASLTGAVLDSVCQKTQSIHDISVLSLNGTTYKLGAYKGRVLVVVNVASLWGLAFPQYPALNALSQAYKGKVEVLAFPCNQFLLQEPEANEQIYEMLKYVQPGGGFVPNFPMHAKVEVNGAKAHPLFVRLKRACPAVKEEIGDPANFFWSPISNNDITWNFQKFLIDADGIPVKRYDPAILPSMLKTDIDKLLAKKN